MPRIKHTKFQGLLYDKFVGSDEFDVREVCRKTGLKPSTLYHYIEGESTFPVDLLPLLYNTTKDTDFLNFILDDTDMMLTPRQEGEGKKSTLAETLDAAAAVGLLVAVVQEALEDSHISDLDKERINKAVNKAQKELEDIKKRVRR